MKRVLLLVLVLAMLLPIAACGKKEDASSVASESASESTSASLPSSGSVSAPPASSVAPVPETMKGTFIAIDELRYEDKNAPQFELSEDGTFTMKVNTGEGGDAGFTGTYTLSGTNLVLTVVERQGEDFLGQRITSMPFTKLSEDHFRYGGEPLGLTRAGDQFTRNGIPPMDITPSSSAPLDSGAQSGLGVEDMPAASAASPAQSSSK